MKSPPEHFEVTIEIVKEGDEPVMYVKIGEKQIAKRYSGQNWISLEPGYTVHGSEPTITIEYNPDAAKSQ